MKISIKGTIVSPDYDDDIFASWIDKGLITPSSRIVSAIENASDPIDLYVNSCGGDVFAGGEMMIALLKAHASGKLASVEVGTLAASMAANIVAALKANGVKITAHSNTMLMFHGCYTTTDGGAQHHEDVAASLRNINESVIANLNRIGINECRAWFAEGREKWLGSDELVQLGLVDTVVDGEDSAMAEMKHTAARLAAFASAFTSRKEYKMNIDEQIPVNAEGQKHADGEVSVVDNVTDEAVQKAVEATEVDSEDKDTKESAKPAEQDIDALVESRANARFAALQSAHDKKFNDLTHERDDALKSLTEANAKVTSLEAEIATLNDSLADVRDQLAAEKSAHESVTKAALRPVVSKNDPWRDAYRAARKISN